MRKITTILCAALLTMTLSSQIALAQDNKDAAGNSNNIGLRAGFPSGISYQHFMDNSSAIEVIAAFYYNRGINLTALYEYHQPIGTSGLGWYVGAGADVTYYTYSNLNESIGIGIDFIAGLQFKFPSIPLSVSADWKPSYSVLGVKGFEGAGGGLTLRYHF